MTGAVDSSRWRFWMTEEEIAARARVVPYSVSTELPTARQLARFRAMLITPVLLRSGSALIFIGNLSSDGGATDNDPPSVQRPTSCRRDPWTGGAGLSWPKISSAGVIAAGASPWLPASASPRWGGLRRTG